MSALKAIALATVVLCASLCVCDAYKLVDNFQGSTFISGFNWFTAADPTHGYVSYVSQSTAAAKNLTYVAGNVVYIKSDSNSVASNPGRLSVRLESKKTYNKGLFVIDVAHMPTGCGNWPAIWTVGGNWPYGGEIDIIEGVNKQTKNQMTLHTGPGCTIPSNWNQLGTTSTTDCNSANGANGNAGCAVISNSASSFGAPFNAAGGGVWAVQWESSGIFMWYFARSAVPANIKNNAPDTATWGTPAASFPFTGTGPGSCASSNFANHQIVIDNTFCGDWAGNTFNNDGCSGSCVSYVQNNPSQFKEAYWAINKIQYYQ